MRLLLLFAVASLLPAASAGAASPADHLLESSPAQARPCMRAAAEHPAGSDADRDGVPDSEDRCVASDPGAAVAPDGCVRGDAVPRCAAAPAAAPPTMLEPRAALDPARDADGDGVGDGEDRCPGTPRATAVDDSGCVLIEQVVLRGVSFATGSAVLRPEAHATLRTVAQAMKVNDTLEVEVGGHTDSVGNDARNLALSQRRAEAVKAFLVREGIPAARLTPRGYGASEPTDTNDTAEGRANNRRVAFKVTDR